MQGSHRPRRHTSLLPAVSTDNKICCGFFRTEFCSSVLQDKIFTGPMLRNLGIALPLFIVGVPDYEVAVATERLSPPLNTFSLQLRKSKREVWQRLAL
jgi:hypothetical protein